MGGGLAARGSWRFGGEEILRCAQNDRMPLGVRREGGSRTAATEGLRGRGARPFDRLRVSGRVGRNRVGATGRSPLQGTEVASTGDVVVGGFHPHPNLPPSRGKG